MGMHADEVIERLTAAPARAGLLLDFDGTLAPIVDDPPSAAMPSTMADLLAALAERLGLLAVISGRPASFLAQQIASPRVVLLGHYGLESWQQGQAVARPEAVQWQPHVAEAGRRLHAALDGIDGVWIENKSLSVAVHWRNATEQGAAEAEVTLAVNTLALESGLQVEPGKLVIELRAPVAWDKGAAATQLIATHALETVVYVGDDLGDLAAFTAVQEAGGIAIAVRGGVQTPAHGEGGAHAQPPAADETPAALLAAADAVLDGPAAVHVWLAALHSHFAL